MTDAKSDILKTCLKFFVRHGVRKMSNEKLAGLLGISTKTLYKYFKDKEDLVGHALQLFYSQQQEPFENTGKEKRASILLFEIWKHAFEMEYKVNKIFFRDLHHYYPELERKVEARITKKIWKRFTEIINRGKEEGDIREEIVPEAVLEGISVLYVSVVRKNDFKKFGLSINAILLNTIFSYLRGICTQKGIQRLDIYISNSIQE